MARHNLSAIKNRLYGLTVSALFSGMYCTPGMARHNPPAIEDLLYGLRLARCSPGWGVKQHWAQSVRAWVTGAYNATGDFPSRTWSLSSVLSGGRLELESRTTNLCPKGE
jgi:hypothetical protein